MVNFCGYCKQLKSRELHGEMAEGWVIIINNANEREQMYWAKKSNKISMRILVSSAGSKLLFCVFTDNTQERQFINWSHVGRDIHLDP